MTIVEARSNERIVLVQEFFSPFSGKSDVVFRFSPEGKYLARFGGQGREPGQYGPPSAIASDPRGRVYVCESFDKIHVYEPDGRFVRTLKIPHAAEALTFDAQNDLYIAGGHKVSKLVLDK